MDGCDIRSHHEVQHETIMFVDMYRGIIRNQGFVGGAGFRLSAVGVFFGAVLVEHRCFLLG